MGRRSRRWKLKARLLWDRWFGPEEVRLEAMVGPPGVWQECREFQIDFLRAQGVTPTRSVLDIGCGPLRGGLPMIEYLDVGRYAGIDIRDEVIREAEKQIAKHGLTAKEPSVAVSSSFGAEEFPDREFDVVWCFQVLYHMDDELVERCIGRIAEVLTPDGFCYGNVNVKGGSGSWKEFPFVRRPVEFYEEIAGRHGLVVRDLGELRDHGYTTKLGGQYNRMLEFRLAT